MHGLQRWDDLRVFLAIVREGSFSAAARSLSIEQSTVSRRIAALEQSVGAPLFDRLPEGPRPTELADRLCLHAEQVEAHVLAFDDAVRSQSFEVAGSVRIALTESFAVQVVLPRVLGVLRERYPKLAVELLASDAAADLSRRQADLALRFFRPPGGDLVAKRVAVLPLAVLGHKRYLRGKPRVPSALHWIVTRVPGVAMPEHDLLSRQLRVAPALTVSSHLLQVEAVRAGLGVALLAQPLRELYPELVELELGLSAQPPVELWLVAPRALRSAPHVAAVWRLLEEQLGQLGAG